MKIDFKFFETFNIFITTNVTFHNDLFQRNLEEGVLFR